MAVSSFLFVFTLGSSAQPLEISFFIVLGCVGVGMAMAALLDTAFGCDNSRNECVGLTSYGVSCEDIRSLGACPGARTEPSKPIRLVLEGKGSPSKPERTKPNLRVAYDTAVRYARWVLSKRLPIVNALALVGVVVFAMAGAGLLMQESGAEPILMGNGIRKATLVVVCLYVWRLTTLGRAIVIVTSLVMNAWVTSLVVAPWPAPNWIEFAAAAVATWCVLIMENTVESLIDGGML